MTAEEMLYEFELSADKVSSKSVVNLPLPAKVAYLNRGQSSLILSKYGGNNLYRAGFEESRLRIDDLQALVVPEEVLKVERVKDGLYSADLKQTKQPFLILIRSYIHGRKANCSPVKVILKETQLDDLEVALRDPFRKPDFQWREALMTTSDNKLFFHTGDFIADDAVIDYLRHPRKIDVSGYVHFDGSDSKDVSCELPEHVHIQVVNEAVLNLKADLNDPSFQVAAAKLQKSE